MFTINYTLTGDMDSEEALKMIKDMLENSVANPSVFSTRRKSLSPELLVNLQATACIVVQVVKQLYRHPFQ